MIGTPVGKLRLIRRLSKGLLLKRVAMDSEYLRRCQAEHPKLIYVITHGGPISFVPLITALISRTAEHDPERLLVGSFHPAWWKIPLVRRMPAYLTSSEEHYSMADIERALQTQPTLDYYALPESETCIYGDQGEVKPFRFHGFIELSLRARVPMMLVAHKGSEHWHRQIDFSGRLSRLLAYLPDRAYHLIDFNKQIVLDDIAQRRVVNVPLPTSRVSLDVALELYYPADFENGVAEDWKQRRRYVFAEGERIRDRLQSLYDRLP